ncbi:uncharacterized protein B0I36DRAFT_337840 [Microdochium trichocladiopsis]|uniref:Uncharacterized protein n=1 Tax=Microdochium trichocladiopsis TaxID=1682393 RepID=A0A9P9BJ69_9PEZI|nr:uncharacterized protein B0I36DRAFT_337840 [Microdochium trichocladiopsis]KAH7016481.1 hypothetical protein B0I36DRAFT_337840 [Microdochium trichocladiopsis]
MVFPSFLTLCGADHSSTRDRVSNKNRNTNKNTNENTTRTITCLFCPEGSIIQERKDAHRDERPAAEFGQQLSPGGAKKAHVDPVEILKKRQELLQKAQGDLDEEGEKLCEAQELVDKKQRLLNKLQNDLDQEKKRLNEEQELDTVGQTDGSAEHQLHGNHHLARLSLPSLTLDSWYAALTEQLHALSEVGNVDCRFSL